MDINVQSDPLMSKATLPVQNVVPVEEENESYKIPAAVPMGVATWHRPAGILTAVDIILFPLPFPHIHAREALQQRIAPEA